MEFICDNNLAARQAGGTKIGEAALADNGVQTIADAVKLVPSFQATTQGDHGVITMTLRGVGNDSAKTEYADPEVAMFVNGIYAPRAEGASALLFDLSSIEVLRGPQGTLWGRNSTVGAVNMQTIRPELAETSGYFEGGLGNYNRLGTKGAFNFALGETAAMRIAFIHEQHDGYVEYQAAPHLSLGSQQAAYAAGNGGSLTGFQAINPNLFVQGDSAKKYNSQDQSGLRLSLLWKILPSLTWDVSYEKYLDKGAPSMNLMQSPRDGQNFWSALIDTAPSVSREANTVRSRLDWDLGNNMSLAYVSGYSRFTGASDFDQDGGAGVPTSFTTGATYQQDRTNHSTYFNQSHELTLQSTGKQTVDWILGAYYAAEDNSIRFDIPIMNGTQQGSVGWQGSFIQPKETVDSKAVFGQATWNASEALHLTGGLRYTSDKRTNEGGTNNGWAYDATLPAVPVDPNNPVLGPGTGFTTYQHNDGEYKSSKTTWLVRAGYDVSKDFLVYGSISSGYKSGGLQDGGFPYGPETLINYEVGTKNTFMGGKVRFNNAMYYEDFKDYQFSAPVTYPNGTRGLATSNAEGAKIYGFESELAWQVTPADLMQFVGSYTHTELGHLIAGSNDYALPPCAVPGISNCLDVTGHRMPHAPTGSITAQYSHMFSFDRGDTLTPRISFHYESGTYLSVFNLGDGDWQKAYSRTDLGLRYASPKSWYVDAFVRNVENAKVKTNAQNSFNDGKGNQVWQSQYLPPITYGMNAGLTF